MKKLLALLLLIPLIAIAQPPVQGTPGDKGARGEVGPTAIEGSGPIDPTKNVLDLVHAEVKRQDDLTGLNDKLTQSKIDNLQEQIKNGEEVTSLKAQHNADMIKLRGETQELIDEKESKRLDAVRAVDQLAVKTESERSATAIQALAKSQEVAADTLRNAVIESAKTLATQNERANSAIIERIAALEKSSYTGIGRSGVTDPQSDKVTAAVDKLLAIQSQSSGKSEGISATMGLFIALGGLALAALMFVFGKNGVKRAA